MRGEFIYRVRAQGGDQHHFMVRVSEFDLNFATKHYGLLVGERDTVGHAAWKHLLANEKDQWGNDTGRPSSTARVLRKLCESVPGGVNAVKERFVKTIVFERVDHDQAH